MTGILTFSIEVELGWGTHDLGTWDHLSEDGRTERRALSALLAVTDECSVPMSFDVVGHLFLEECSGSHASPHAGDWFRRDPGTDRQHDGLFYAPDVVDAIREAETDHEICTHTFSHALFNDVSREVADWEFSRVQELHRDRLGAPTTSLVPPRHHSPPYDLLDEHGIGVIRPAERRSADSKVRRFKELLAGPIPHSRLRETDGVVETSCTTNPTLTAASLPSGQRRAHPAFRYLPVGLRKRYHLESLKRATKEAADRDAHVHLWCHLFDLSNDLQIDVVGEYLRWLATFRDDRELTVARMEDLPAYV